MKLTPDARFPTLCIHAGQEPDPATGAIITPIYQTSTYVQDGLGRHKGYEYARTQNPTRAALEANVAALEGGAQGFAFASGMAAIGAVASLLQAGEHAVVGDNTYGGTFRLFEKVLRRQGITRDLRRHQRHRRRRRGDPAGDAAAAAGDADQPDDDADRSRRRRPTWPTAATSPSSSTTRSRARRCSGRSTFGCDLVLHSTTKYLNGHSDSIGGIVVATRDDHREWLSFYQNAYGAILSPFDSWLVLRGTKTLALRMAQHNANGLALATFLAGHPKVTRVLYPGLPDHPQHALAKAQMSGFGGMLAFDMGSIDAARRVRRARADLRARRKPRRRRVADRPSRVDDPRLGAAGAACRARSRRRPGPDLGRHRRPGRPDRRSRAGARLSSPAGEFRQARVSACSQAP